MRKILEVLEELPQEMRFPLVKAFEVLKEEVADTVTKADFEKLMAVVRDLVEANQRAEDRLSKLEVAMVNAEERLARLESAMVKAEERLAKLEVAMVNAEERLARLEVAMVKAEERLTKLEVAMVKAEERLTRLEKAVEELTEAQKRTEEQLRKLAEAQDRIWDELGGLAHTVGYRLEDEAMKSLPAILKQDCNVEVIGKLKRTYIEVGKGRFEEVNIWGTAKRDEEEYVVIGEAKSQLRKGAVDTFLEKAERLATVVPKKQLRILVTYQAHPDTEKYARDKGILLFFSYEL
jgi:DNA repair exonuclease SbcCD ATPase subunit